MTATAVAHRAFWEEEGRRAAASLEGVAAAVVVGANLEAAALVARGIARDVAARRHVALGDLAGDLAPIYELAGGEDARGLTDCFREGSPLNDIARPALGAGSLFVLPSGTPPVAIPKIFGHERWPRLVAGFARAEALLLLVAAVDAPGLHALVEVTSGVIAVDVPPGLVKRFPVLATIDAPEPPHAPRVSRTKRAVRWSVAALVAVTIGASAWRAFGASAPDRTVGEIPRALPPPRPSAPMVAKVAEPLILGDPAVPADSTSLAPFAIEVVAANTLAGANSFLADHRETTAARGATVSPVAVGGGTTLWYKVIVGACPDRACADALLDTLRRERLAGDAGGRIVRLPYALLLEDHVGRSQRVQVVRSWLERGVSSYALEQTDGCARVFAGAFETPAQAEPLAVALRATRAVPVVAFRTGRMF